MFAAREDESLPNLYSPALLCLRDRKPFPNESEAIAETAAMIRDANFRIEAAEDGIHCYNRDGHRVTADPFSLYPDLGVEDDASHAFYLGYELARAEVAWRLGKRYVQDQPFDWGAAVERSDQDVTRFKEEGATLKARRRARRKARKGGGGR